LFEVGNQRALPPKSLAAVTRPSHVPDMEKRLEGRPLIVHAVDLVIAEIEQRDESPDREEALALLRELRQALLTESSQVACA
jgi:hypothetical protein